MIVPFFESTQIKLYQGSALDILKKLDSESVDTCVTSPPYFGLRSYLPDNSPEKHLELGLEATVQEYVANMVEIFNEVRRVLKPTGTVFLNLGDSYAGKPGGAPGINAQVGNTASGCQSIGGQMRLSGNLKPKDLCMIPHRVAIALQDAGWWVRSDIVWAKGNPMPESVTDRPTRSHEYIFLLAKSERYFYNAEAIKEIALTQDNRRPYARGQVDSRGNGHDRGGGTRRKTECTQRNRRSVWNINTQPYPESHFAVFPSEIPRLCILAGCPEGGTVLEPFCGSGTTAYVAQELGRKAIAIDLNPTYLDLAVKRCQQQTIFGALMEVST